MSPRVRDPVSSKPQNGPRRSPRRTKQASSPQDGGHVEYTTGPPPSMEHGLDQGVATVIGQADNSGTRNRKGVRTQPQKSAPSGSQTTTDRRRGRTSPQGGARTKASNKGPHFPPVAETGDEGSLATELGIACSDAERLQTQLSLANSKIAELVEEINRVRDLVGLPSLGVTDDVSGDTSVAIQLGHLFALKDKQMEELRRNLAAATSRNTELQKSHDTLLTDLSSARDELKLRQRPSARQAEPSCHCSKHSSRWPSSGGKNDIANAKIDQLRRAKALKAEELALANKEREQLHLRAEELTRELEKSYGDQSGEHQSQLHVLQRFTTTADLHTDTTITQMLQKLNAEVQQNTTFIAESVLEAPQPQTKKLTGRPDVSGYIGPKLADCLKGDDVALYLPIAFQAYLSYQLCDIIASWTVDKGNSDFIKGIYHRLQEKEVQMISGNWRSLTRTHISQTCLSDPHQHISSIFAGFSDIVVAAGCALPDLAAELLSPFKDKVSSMILIAGQLSKMIGEVVSGEFEVFAARPEDTFEEITMEEDADDYDRKEEAQDVTAMGQKVLCSTYLGLMKQVQGPQWGARNTATVVKTKVLFESFLESA